MLVKLLPLTFALLQPLAPRTPYQTGQASYYASHFHGRQTANGERFNRQRLTAAHRSLPFGTVVEVRSCDQTRRVTVTINDRGPFSRGRVIDLSPAAFAKLAPLSQGVACVHLHLQRERMAR